MKRARLTQIAEKERGKPQAAEIAELLTYIEELEKLVSFADALATSVAQCDDETLSLLADYNEQREIILAV